ncbi:hypothetical protein [Micromonospora tulbaghiae]|uniref:hypothetical protein n=1 Tax=Micromonospora tulbaghiae TaxID=479978 RepID=UPI0036C4397A
MVRHEHHVFHNPPPSTPAEVQAALDRDDLPAALDAMVGTALYGDGDWRELQELHLRLLDHEDHQVSALAATCLGHLARVYRQLDERRVVAALRRARALPHTSGTAENALDDIQTSSTRGAHGGADGCRLRSVPGRGSDPNAARPREWVRDGRCRSTEGGQLCW